MRLPPIPPVNQSDIYVNGEVIIHETAMIASGVILQASPNHQIRIGEGVCLGMGVVISASQGDIEIASGAVLGAGVLVTGSGKIGQNACIGASSTLMKVSVEAQSVIPSGSLVGDTSRQMIIPPAAEFKEIASPSPNGNKQKTPPPEDLWQEPPPKAQEPQTSNHQTPSDQNSPPLEPEVEPEETVELTPQPSPHAEKSQPVVGQMYINQLLVKLFPEREAYKRSQDNQRETE
jgi:carbon dioxide concentrating mechanism protein CcmN